MKTGKVKFYNKEKGFGFIQDTETGKDVFVHATGLTAPIYQDDEVEFDTAPDKNGRADQAVNVTPL